MNEMEGVFGDFLLMLRCIHCSPVGFKYFKYGTRCPLTLDAFV